MNRKYTMAFAFILAILGIGMIVFYAANQWGMNIYEVDDLPLADPSACPGDMHFAVIGDYGFAGEPEEDVAALVHSWDVDFIVTVGDNNYPDGEWATIDRNIGQYYSDYIFPYEGAYGEGAGQNRFWPALGNHDLDTANGQPYLDYFELPGNERYYDFQKGDAHFFILNSDRREADGRASNSIQARWLQAQMSQSTAAWKLIFMHHTPFTSSWRRSPDKEIQWPFAEWGATAVFSGHDHFYERAEAEDIPYFVNGAGGKQLYRFGTAVPESVVRYNLDYGAMRVQVEEGCINFAFYNRGRELIDSITIWE